MKGYTVLLLLVVTIICIENNEAWRRWRVRFRWRRSWRTITTVSRVIVAGKILLGKRDLTEAASVPLPYNKSCEMAHYDKNKDKTITKDELMAVFHDVEKNKDLFGKFDANGDGRVDETEFSVKVGVLIAECQKKQ